MASKKSVVDQAPSLKKSRNEEVEFIGFNGEVEMKVISTTCKTFGACMYDAEFNIGCRNCKQSPEVKEACQIMTGTFIPVVQKDLAGKEKKTKTEGSGIGNKVGKMADLKASINEMFLNGGFTRKTMMAQLLLNFPEYRPVTYGTIISDSANPKYCTKSGIGYLVSKGEGGLLKKAEIA